MSAASFSAFREPPDVERRCCCRPPAPRGRRSSASKPRPGQAPQRRASQASSPNPQNSWNPYSRPTSDRQPAPARPVRGWNSIARPDPPAAARSRPAFAAHHEACGHHWVPKGPVVRQRGYLRFHPPHKCPPLNGKTPEPLAKPVIGRVFCRTVAGQGTVSGRDAAFAGWLAGSDRHRRLGARDVGVHGASLPVMRASTREEMCRISFTSRSSSRLFSIHSR